MQIGIVGLGLIGGSLAKALKEYTRHTVLGKDIDGEVLAAALRDGVIEAPLEPEDLGRCDLVIVALYPAAAVDYIKRHAAYFKKGSVVVDCCGVKRGVVRSAAAVARRHGFTFVGTHPMAGIERSGYSASCCTLFKGASLIVTPSRDTPASAVRLLSELAPELGFGRVCLSSPSRHDRIIAYTSQLAHAVSCAYVTAPLAGKSEGFSAGSFADMTRVARLNEGMWTELFLDNRENLCRELDGLCSRLAGLSAAIRAGDRDRLGRMLRQARRTKERMDRE